MSKVRREAKNGVRSIASALGIQRHELGAYTRMKNNEPPPLFPPIMKPLLPNVTTSVTLLDYRCNIQDDLSLYYNGLETNTYVVKDDPITHRYSDDFLHSERSSFVPSNPKDLPSPVNILFSEMCDLPKGLYPPATRKRLAAKEKAEANAKKAKKMEKLLNQLEAKEKNAATDDENETDEEAKDDDDDDEPPIVASDEEEDIDNDYSVAYFGVF